MIGSLTPPYENFIANSPRSLLEIAPRQKHQSSRGNAQDGVEIEIQILAATLRADVKKSHQ